MPHGGLRRRRVCRVGPAWAAPMLCGCRMATAASVGSVRTRRCNLMCMETLRMVGVAGERESVYIKGANNDAQRTACQEQQMARRASKRRRRGLYILRYREQQRKKAIEATAPIIYPTHISIVHAYPPHRVDASPPRRVDASPPHRVDASPPHRVDACLMPLHRIRSMPLHRISSSLLYCITSMPLHQIWSMRRCLFTA
jgi:hypothetical protein